ncbi:HNH endonuclease [Motilimonas cestriensis]|uniref:HNH endonuclease n=1 Tax=Motilimonas cestriensis TaxID=2742685 RepID=A0ABS8WFT8_9GAMM|nr:HNH endonuclease [Motilimonas cestriensis]MCE2597212.1 HNH endonuclease [Motilimonas cestriensis]
MPPRTPKPCRITGCGALTTAKHGYCDQHKHTGWETHQAGRTTTQRGYGHGWQVLRAKRLKLDNYLCQECLALGFAVPAVDVDHVINKANGGKDELNNLRSLCKDHHKRKTNTEKHKNR